MKSLQFDWDNAIAHQKAYAVIRMLEDIVGPDRFVQFLRGLLDRYRDRYLSFEEFQAAKRCGSSSAGSAPLSTDVSRRGVLQRDLIAK